MFKNCLMIRGIISSIN